MEGFDGNGNKKIVSCGTEVVRGRKRGKKKEKRRIGKVGE